jgi:hypothetical protein
MEPNNKIVEFKRKVNEKFKDPALAEDPDLKAAALHLYRWQRFNTGCFHDRLFELICKADELNQARLMQGFQCEVMVWIIYMNSPTPNDFYKLFEINLNKGD